MATFYETLEVSPRASAAVVRAAFRCLAQLHHPDKCAATVATDQTMADINRAYAVLSDAVKREAYDRSLGIAGDMHERRGLGLSAAQRTEAHSQGHTGIRPFAFRPLV
jgi:DnaJ-class molecular chaperone